MTISRMQGLVIVSLLAVTPVDLQMMPVPMAVPVPMPFPVAVMYPKDKDGKATSTTTTTTTTEAPAMGIPIPIPVPVPVQVPMQVPYNFPAFPNPVCQKARPPGCPPCPPCVCSPSCTPAFFSYCSPCHLQCRCRNKEEVPEPVPMGPPAPPPVGQPYGFAVPMMPRPMPMVVVYPFPPSHIRPEKEQETSIEDCKASDSDTETASDSESECSEDSDSDDDCSSSRYSHRKKKKRKKGKKRVGHMKKRPKLRLPVERRQFNIEKGDEVKPVLSFITNTGDVKLRRELTNVQAIQLLKDTAAEKIELGLKTNGGSSGVEHRRRQAIIPRKLVREILEGRREVAFRSPPGAAITNLSMSFLMLPKLS